MWQTAFNIFQRVLFYTLDSSLIFSPGNHIAVRKYLRDIFAFPIQKKHVSGVFMHLERKLKQNEIFLAPSH